MAKRAPKAAAPPPADDLVNPIASGAPTLHPWAALREDYLARNTVGRISLSAFAREKGIDPSVLRLRAAEEGWLAEAHRRHLELTRKAWAALEIDQLEIRKSQVAALIPATQLLVDEIRIRAANALEAHARGVPSMGMDELRKLQQMVTELATVGAGLPRVHRVGMDDLSELAFNRDEMRRLEGKATSLLDWAKQKGVGPFKVVEGGKADTKARRQVTQKGLKRAEEVA